MFCEVMCKYAPDKELFTNPLSVIGSTLFFGSKGSGSNPEGDANKDRLKMSTLNNKKLLKEAISKSSTKGEVLEHMGLRPVGGNFKTLKFYADKFGLELPCFDYGEHLSNYRQKIPDEIVFVENSKYCNRQNLKNRLINNGILKNKCSKCPITDTWNGLPIVLQLDHINGIGNDNRIENLRLLCPNCHSQTETFCGKNKMIECQCGNQMHFRAKTCEKCKYKPSSCKCGNRKHVKSEYCIQCSNGVRYGTESKYPPLQELEAMVEEHGFSGAGRLLGVSDNAIRKRLAKLRKVLIAE